MSDKLTLAKKKLEWAKSWPEEGDERDSMIAKAQQAVSSAQAELNAARPLGTQLKSLTDKVEAHTRTVTTVTESLAAAEARVVELRDSLKTAQDALAAAQAEHQALVRQADTGPPAQAAGEATPTADLLRLLISRSKDPQVTALLGTWVQQEATEATATAKPVACPAGDAAAATAVGGNCTGAAGSAADGAHKTAVEPRPAPSAGAKADGRPSKRQCIPDADALKGSGLPPELLRAIEAARAKGTTVQLSPEMNKTLATAAAAAQLDPSKADLAASLLAAVEASDVSMGEP